MTPTYICSQRITCWYIAFRSVFRVYVDMKHYRWSSINNNHRNLTIYVMLKWQVLAALIDQHNRDENRDKNKEVIIHFVEDRFETLLAVMKVPALDSVQLYLVDWGYNTKSQREEAKKLFPRVKLINGEDFKALATSFIQWGFRYKAFFRSILLLFCYVCYVLCRCYDVIWCAVMRCHVLS